MTEQEMSGAVGFISEVVFYLLCLDCGFISVMFGLWNWVAVRIADHLEYNGWYDSYF